MIRLKEADPSAVSEGNRRTDWFMAAAWPYKKQRRPCEAAPCAGRAWFGRL